MAFKRGVLMFASKPECWSLGSMDNQHQWKLSLKSKSYFAKRYYDFLQTLYFEKYWLVYQCAYVGGWLMDNCFVTGRLMIFQWTVTVFSIVTGIWKVCSTLPWWLIQDKIKTGPSTPTFKFRQPTVWSHAVGDEMTTTEWSLGHWPLVVIWISGWFWWLKWDFKGGN